MNIRKQALIATLVTLITLPFLAAAQQWPGRGPGPYAPNGAGQYGAGNPYASQLNELAIKDMAKHEVCYTQANEKNLRQEPRWKFMLECMKK